MKEVSTSFLKEGNYSDFISLLNGSDTDYIHFDVMDGVFVSNKNLSVKELCNYINLSNKKNDIHLMVMDPVKYIEKIKTLNVSNITIHREIPDYDDVIDLIKSYGIRAGLAINPETSVSAIERDLSNISLVLVMGVHPGRSGQHYIDSVTDKINELCKIRKRRNLSFKISVDGGVCEEVLDKLSNVDVVVSASFVLDNLDNINKIHSL